MIEQLIMNSIILGSIYSVIAFGFTLMYDSMNFFNMAYGANALIGAYAFYVFYSLLNMPIVIAALLACIITAALMLIIDRVCYHRLRKKKVPSWSLVVISMSVSLILQSIVTMIFGSRQFSVYKDFPKTYTILGAHLTSVQLIIFVVAIALMILMTMFLKKTKTGKMIRALANDKQMAMVIGIDAERVYTIITAVVSVMASCAAIFLAIDTDMRPGMGGPILLKAITCSIIGGVGNIKGALIAAFAMGFLESGVTLLFNSGWRDAFSLIILVILMIAKPSYFGIAQET